MLINNRTQAKLERWKEILLSCDKHNYLTTSQIQRLHKLGTSRNTTRILNDMDKYLQSFRDVENVWYLSAEGRKEIGSNNIRKKVLNVTHTLIRNECYIAWRPCEWRIEFSIKYDGHTMIADALYRISPNSSYKLLEVDHMQHMSTNEKKIEQYKTLRDSGRWKHGLFPEVVYVTTSEYRKKRLEVMLKGIGRVYLVDEIK